MNEVKNMLITGKPGRGKTTLIKEILKELKIPAQGGFFTEEIRKKGERIGFKIKTLKGGEGILAEKSFHSPYRVSKYWVNLNALEEIGVKEVEEALSRDLLVVIDEIGKMELFSSKFKETVLKVLNSKNKFLGTIMLQFNSFCDAIKKRKDTRTFYLDRKN